jgi:hypothetical protein
LVKWLVLLLQMRVPLSVMIRAASTVGLEGVINIYPGVRASPDLEILKAGIVKFGCVMKECCGHALARLEAKASKEINDANVYMAI